MGKYKKILVAVDGSESSKNAFIQACKVAHENGSWLTVVTTIPLYQDQFEVLSTKEKVTKALREEGEKILTAIKQIADAEHAFIHKKLEEGSPVDTIIDIAEEGNYDLIVMGRRGKSHLEKTLVGSVTARVIGNSQRDVLVVPLDASLGWDSILLATDGSKHSRIASEKSVDLAASYGAKIRAVSVVDVTEEFYSEAPDAVDELVIKAKGYVNDVREKAESRNVTIETLVREGETYKIITDLARDSGAHIIIMGSHGRTGVRRLLMGSITEKVIGYAPCPVLVVKS
jgi:nucleotide-binding universal stress UspA family protein